MVVDKGQSNLLFQPTKLDQLNRLKFSKKPVEYQIAILIRKYYEHFFVN